MQLFRFDTAVGRSITRYDSVNFTISPIVRRWDAALPIMHIGCMHIGAGGVVGYHQATVPQLFLVVQGDGWVTSTERIHQPIATGQAAFWQQGEWHESGSHDGMTVIVIEAEHLDPVAWMTAVD
jgi:gentisate 1,2-dioxygenase